MARTREKVAAQECGERGALRGSGGESGDSHSTVTKPPMVDDAHTHGETCARYKDVFGSLSQ